MSITIKKYVDITSGVLVSSTADERELIERIFTTNSLMPVNSFAEFTSLEEVQTFFGESSNEALRAVAPFSFIGKTQTKVKKMSYAGYSTVPTEPLINGTTKKQSLTALQEFTSATLTLTIGGIGGTTSSIDLSSETSISDAIAVIEAAIQNIDASVMFASSTTIFDPVLNRVIFTGGDTGFNELILSSVTSGFLSELGWALGVGISDGTNGDSLTSVITMSDNASDNFGSITFVEKLVIDDIEEVATVNNSFNVKYIYNVPTTTENAQLYTDTLSKLSGTAVTLVDNSETDLTESTPSILLASTNYSGTNSVIGYMYQTMNDLYPVSVTDTTISDTLDELRVNYIGQTQQAGKAISFYQRGLLLGSSNSPLDMNTYANEMWLKDSITVVLINLVLAVDIVSADSAGEAQITSTIHISIRQGLSNSTIIIGKSLSDADEAFILSITGDENAASQVQSNGYYLTVKIVTVDNEKQGQYRLIYTSDEQVRSFEGQNSLI